jgi:hypothetical protein
MATWEDGPEYAPVERPTDFSVPDAPALEEVPPPQPPADAPADRPVFGGPETPVPQLTDLVPAVGDVRDPLVPFEVVTTTVTSDSAWGAAHWSTPANAGRPAVPAAPTAALVAGWSPPQPSPAPADTRQWDPPAWGDPPSSGGFPAPGTPQWFGPGPPAERPMSPEPVTVRRVVDAATPGVLICLVLGGFFQLLAPITATVAFGLSSRITAGQQKVQRSFLITLGFLSFFALLGVLVTGASFDLWWGYVGSWAMAASWVLLVIVLVTVTRALRNPPQPPGPPPSW